MAVEGHYINTSIQYNICVEPTKGFPLTADNIDLDVQSLWAKLRRESRVVVTADVGHTLYYLLTGIL